VRRERAQGACAGGFICDVPDGVEGSGE